ncbi:hypothetical protein SFRURICE_014769 [Spodoptera frugiperda]|nr:hypothetical protein SFRURICE_014769 [Spodoptera frugiperda]
MKVSSVEPHEARGAACSRRCSACSWWRCRRRAHAPLAQPSAPQLVRAAHCSRAPPPPPPDTSARSSSSSAQTVGGCSIASHEYGNGRRPNELSESSTAELRPGQQRQRRAVAAHERHAVRARGAAVLRRGAGRLVRGQHGPAAAAARPARERHRVAPRRVVAVVVLNAPRRSWHVHIELVGEVGEPVRELGGRAARHAQVGGALRRHAHAQRAQRRRRQRQRAPPPAPRPLPPHRQHRCAAPQASLCHTRITNPDDILGACSRRAAPVHVTALTHLTPRRRNGGDGFGNVTKLAAWPRPTAPHAFRDPGGLATLPLIRLHRPVIPGKIHIAAICYQHK